MFEFTAALGALKGTWDLARVALDARDDAKLRTALSDMAARLLDVQTSALGLADQVSSLQGELLNAQAQLRELQGRLAEREQYVLHELAPGFFVYRFQPLSVPADGRPVPVHHLCQPCFDAGKKGVLRISELTAKCNLCQVSVGIREAPTYRMGHDPLAT